MKKYLNKIFSKQNLESGIGVTGIIVTTLIVGAAFGVASGLIGDKIARGFAYSIGYTLTAVSSALFNLAARFLTYVLSPEFTDGKIVNDPVFNSAWASVRDMSNMLIVLGFVAVGIATTLRLRDYEAKKLLFPLIGVAMLINFSGLLCDTVIKGADIATTALLQQGAASANFTALQEAVNNYVRDGLNGKGEPGAGFGAGDTNSPLQYIGVSASLAVFQVFAAYIFFILACLLAARYAMLAVLYILSPLAFVAFVFPATKDKFSKWWNEFLKWSFVGVTSAFFIYLSVSVLLKGGAQIQFKVMAVSFVFLYIGYKLAKSGSAMGAGAIVGLAAASAKFATGAVGKVGLAAGGGQVLSRAGGMMGKTETAKRTRDWLANATARTNEFFGGAEGSAARAQTERAKESRSTLEALRTSKNAGDRAKYESYVKKGRGIMGAEAVALANEKKDFGKIMGNDTEAMRGRMGYASSFGYKTDDFVKYNPNLAETPEKVREAVQKLSGEDFAKNVHESSYTPEVVAAMNQEQIQAVFGRHGSAAKRDALQKAVGSEAFGLYGKSLKSRPVAQRAFADNIEFIKAGGRHSTSSPTTKTSTPSSSSGAATTSASASRKPVTPPKSGAGYRLEGESEDYSLEGEDRSDRDDYNVV